MTFQGDVRGIGLAELLQGLARGRKEGVLTLTAKGGLRSVLGIEDGKSWLLPDPDEEPNEWRTRVRDAWADDPEFTMSSDRMEQIAKAARTEILYTLLDGEGVHFRFEPGALPDRTTRLEEEGAQSTEVHCPPTQVEFLLLEYARLADELESRGEAANMAIDTIPCIQDHTELSQVPPQVLEQCNGNSTIEEIADRLGWPIRQVRLELARPLEGGGLRVAHPIEVLRLALYELERKQFSRAGKRLSLWTRVASPGPLVAEDAEALSNEWLAGRLTAALRTMSMREVRCILRRLDHSLGNPNSTLVHWTEAARIGRTDRIVRLKAAAAQLRAEGEECSLDARDVLDLARDMREHGSAWRSGPALAIAAYQQPESNAQRLELGMGLVAAGRPEDAGPWVVTACTEILNQGHADRVLSPLRQLLEVDPRNRDARQLLTRAKRSSTRTKRVRRNILIGAAIVATAASGAFVKVRSERQRVAKLEQIRSLLDDPLRGLAQLDSDFATDSSAQIQDLRRELEERLRTVELQLRAGWLEEYHAVQKVAHSGDPVSVPERLRTLPRPPQMRILTEPWPARHDVLIELLQRLEAEVSDLGRPTADNPQQVTVERRVLEQLEGLRDALTEEERTSTAHKPFLAGIEELEDVIALRDEARSVEAFEQERADRLAENDRLLQLARQAEADGDYERALRHYDEIVSRDATGRVRTVLENEIASVRKKQGAVEDARELALDGDHEAAFQRLVDAFETADGVMLPFDVATVPSGATVYVNDRQPRVTPFTVEGTFDGSWQLRFELAGFEPRTIQVEGPQDISLNLSRRPERAIASEARIEAVPVPVADDHIVVDRDGRIARIGLGGGVVWESSVQTLSGIARAPVEMPGRPGELLFVTETGAAWVVSADTGELDGPWELGAPPVVGPATVGEEVQVILRGGQLARWRASLRPVVEAVGVTSPLGEELRFGEVFGAGVARSREHRLATLAAPTGRWTVEVREDIFFVTPSGQPEKGFPISRQGDWTFVAWTPPATGAPEGRLWVSDGYGLRAILP